MNMAVPIFPYFKELLQLYKPQSFKYKKVTQAHQVFANRKTDALFKADRTAKS